MANKAERALEPHRVLILSDDIRDMLDENGAAAGLFLVEDSIDGPDHVFGVQAFPVVELDSLAKLEYPFGSVLIRLPGLGRDPVSL